MSESATATPTEVVTSPLTAKISGGAYLVNEEGVKVVYMAVAEELGVENGKIEITETRLLCDWLKIWGKEFADKGVDIAESEEFIKILSAEVSKPLSIDAGDGVDGPKLRKMLQVQEWSILASEYESNAENAKKPKIKQAWETLAEDAKETFKSKTNLHQLLAVGLIDIQGITNAFIQEIEHQIGLKSQGR